MTKRFVRQHGSGRKIPIDTDPQLKAVLGQNIYLQDGTTLLDLTEFVNSISTSGAVLSPTPTPTPSPSGTQAKVLGRLPNQNLTPSTIPFSLPAIAKGDLMVNNGSMVVRLPVGADGEVLIADHTVTDGVRWGAPSNTGSPDWLLQLYIV